MPSNGVQVDGLKDLIRELRKLDEKGVLNELKDTNYAVAERVATAAQTRAGSVSRQARKAATTLRPSRQMARAQVSASSPFFAGAEYGSDRFTQFMPYRGSGDDAGYFLWPSIRDETPEIVEMYGDAIEQIVASAFPS